MSSLLCAPLPGLLRFAIESTAAPPSQMIFRALFALQTTLTACDAEVCIKHPDLKGRCDDAMLLLLLLPQSPFPRLLRFTQTGRRAFKIPERGLFAHVTVSAHPYSIFAVRLPLRDFDESSPPRDLLSFEIDSNEVMDEHFPALCTPDALVQMLRDAPQETLPDPGTSAQQGGLLGVMLVNTHTRVFTRTYRHVRDGVRDVAGTAGGAEGQVVGVV